MLPYSLNRTLQLAALLVPSARAPVPISVLTSASSPKDPLLSFHALTNCKFRNPFVLIFIQNAGGVPSAGAATEKLLHRPDSPRAAHRSYTRLEYRSRCIAIAPILAADPSH